MLGAELYYSGWVLSGHLGHVVQVIMVYVCKINFTPVKAVLLASTCIMPTMVLLADALAPLPLTFPRSTGMTSLFPSNLLIPCAPTPAFFLHSLLF